MMDIEEFLLQWFINIFDKKSSSGSAFTIKQNQQPAEELHKPIIREFKKLKSMFIIYRQYLGS